MTDLEKLQHILTHPDYKVSLGASSKLGKYLLVSLADSSKLFDVTFTEFRISLDRSNYIGPSLSERINITPFIYDSSYDGSFLHLDGYDVIRLYESTMDKLINDTRNEVLSAFNLPIEGDTK
jgi:hypothetical protein